VEGWNSSNILETTLANQNFIQDRSQNFKAYWLRDAPTIGIF
jgi:hypothetical protein